MRGTKYFLNGQEMSPLCLSRKPSVHPHGSNYPRTVVINYRVKENLNEIFFGLLLLKYMLWDTNCETYERKKIDNFFLIYSIRTEVRRCCVCSCVCPFPRVVFISIQETVFGWHPRDWRKSNHAAHCHEPAQQ